MVMFIAHRGASAYVQTGGGGMTATRYFVYDFINFSLREIC